MDFHIESLSLHVIVPAALLGLALTASYICCLCIYRIFWHPFARYPGPFWAKLSNAYAGYHAYKQDTHVEIWRCHEKYGDFVRFGPNRLLINRQDALRDVYGQSSNFFKGVDYEIMRISPVPSVFDVHSKAVHRKKRRLVGQGFSEPALRASEPYILTHVRRFCSHMLELEEGKQSTSWTSPKDLAVWTNYLTLDVVSDLVFGQSFGMLIKPEIRFILDFLKGAARHMAISFQIPAAFRKGRPGQWLDLGTWLPPNISNLRADWIKSGETWTLNRIDAEKSGFSRKDVMSSIISAIDPETNQQMTTPEILTEAYVLVTAGGDTTSTAISSTLFYLSRNSVAYAKATAEVRSKFSFEEQISMGPSLNSCAYLRACIDEAMRMSSPVCAPLWRETGPGGATVCGNYVPQGLSCAVGTYAVHHNPAYYADPFRYFPERWLAGEHVTPETLECAKASFSPFSVGPRNCAGKSLAYLEMMLTLARLLWLADIRIPQGNVGHIGEGHSKNEYGRHRPEEFQVYDTFGSGKRGPMLQFKKRTDKIT